MKDEYILDLYSEFNKSKYDFVNKFCEIMFLNGYREMNCIYSIGQKIYSSLNLIDFNSIDEFKFHLNSLMYTQYRNEFRSLK